MEVLKDQSQQLQGTFVPVTGQVTKRLRGAMVRRGLS